MRWLGDNWAVDAQSPLVIFGTTACPLSVVRDGGGRGRAVRNIAETTVPVIYEPTRSYPHQPAPGPGRSPSVVAECGRADVLKPG
jgi:hypothetical protein